MENESRKWLFNALSSKGYNVGKNYAEFDSLMSNNADSRKWAFETAKKHGYNVGKDYNEFEGLINPVQSTSQQAPTEQSKGILGRAKDAMQAHSAYVQQQGQKKLEKAKMKPQPVASQPQQKPTPVEQPQQSTQQPQGSYTPTWQEQMGMGMTIGSAQNAVSSANAAGEKMEQNIKNSSPFGTGQAGLALNKRVRRGKQKFNAETGQFEDTYLTSDGQSFKNVAQASGMQDYLDQVGQYERMKSNIEELGLSDLIGNSDKREEQQLKEAYAERDRLTKILDNDKEGERARRDVIMSGGYDPTPNARLEDRDALNSALRMIDRRIKALEANRDNAGFWQGTADVLTDSSNYSFGLTDLADAHQMEKISRKIQEAKESGNFPRLTEAEKALAKNYLLNQEQQQLNKDNWWYESAGKGFGRTLSFMKDFALTGGGFIGAARGGLALGGKAGTKLATKALGDYMTKNLGTKVLGKIIEYSGKGIGLAAGAEAGGFALNNTAQIASNFADITNKKIGNMTIDKNGQLDFQDSMSLGKAALISQLQRTGENGSELVGLAFDKMPQILGRVIQKTTVGKALSQITNSKYWKAWEKGLGFLGVQSVWGEGMEEEYNMARTEILNRISDNQFAPEGSGFFDWETRLDTWKTVGLTSAILRVPSMIASGVDQAEYYGNKYNLNTSDKELRKVFKLGEWGVERYDAVKSALDGANNQEIAGVLSNLLTNSGLTKEEKEATVKYANDLIKLRGFNIGNVVAAANGYKPQPKVEGYNIKGLHVDAVDGEGNVIESYDYETPEDLKTGLYEMQQKRFDDSLKSDIAAMQARPDLQYFALVSNFLMDNGYGQESETPVSDFEAVLAKPSLERTDAEQQMVQQFAKVLHDTVYDNTMLHEEQSAEDGATAAETASIDMNNPDSPELREAAVAWHEASLVRDQLFANNEELKQEVERMEQQGLSHQEIISALETFAPNEVDAIINYYNQKARFESMMNRVNDKIDEEAANSRQRHTFKGTMNGQSDTSNIYTISDGTNEYYLVSGNIIVSPEGQITDSTSGLIIGMDSDGSFVQLSDTSGYSVMPSQLSADDFEATERERLQQLWTSAIDPTGAMMQQTEQGGILDNAGGEAVVNNDNGANNPPATAPTTSGGENATKMWRATIESVTGEDGVKHYEQGISVDDAIADMEADGLDVNAESDLAINEAQAELDKIKEPKTRAERIKNDTKRKQLQATIDYYNNVKQRYAELHPVYADAQPFLDQLKQAQSKKKADEILNAALQAGVNPDDITSAHAQKVADILAKEEEARKQADEITDRDLQLIRQYKDTPEGRAYLLDRKRVPSAEKRRKIAELIYGHMFDGDFEAWRDIRELISSWLGKGRALDPDSFGQELGWDMTVGKDAAKVSTMFTARRENGGDGMLFNDFVHMVMEASGGRFTTEEIRNELIEMFQGAQEKSDLTEYQLTTRVAEAEKQLQAEEERLKDAAENDEEVVEAPATDNTPGSEVLPFPPSEEQESVEEETKAEEEPKAEEETQTEEVPEVKEEENTSEENALTIEEINNSDFPKQVKTLAIAYLNGNHGELQTAAYQDIYDEVRGEEKQEQQPAEPAIPEGAVVLEKPETWVGKTFFTNGMKLKCTSVDNGYAMFDNLTTMMGMGFDVSQVQKWMKDGEWAVVDESGQQKAALDQIRNNPNPAEAIKEQAAEFRAEQESKEETPEQKRARLKQEILDKAKKLSEMQKKNVRDDLGKLGMNRLTPSFIPRDKEQRKMFWDLVSTTAEYGYTYIQEGVTNFKEWSKRIYDDVVSTMQDIFGWTQEDVDGYTDAVWNAEVEADGQTKTLAEFAAEKSNNPNVSDNTVNDNKNVLQDEENNVNLQQEQKNNNNGTGNQQTESEAGQGNQQSGAGNANADQAVEQRSVGGSVQQSVQQGGTGGVQEVPVKASSERRSAERPDRPVQGLNKNNNHEERGTESAPTSTIGRIEANIEAIELMQKLMEEGRPATDEEKKVLRQFSGWGGLGVAFANPVYQNKIRELLGDEGYEQANMSRNSAYYTPAKIIDRLWDIAKALGFKGGNVLEGSAGVGKIIGLMPTELSESSHIQAVEIDETTGNILKLLYPDAQVDVQGFEETKIPNGSVDLAITNVPFVTGLHVKDNTGDGDLSKKFGNIHDFCIAKNIRKLKEGGIGIFITSKGTLDDSLNLREWISAEGNADVVGAFRLNNETFGGTPVTSDIIIVRKRVNGNKSANTIDVSLPAAVRVAKYDTGKTKKVKNKETGRKEEVRVYRDMPLDYNGYFIEHPEHMGGEMAYRFEKDMDYQPTSKSCFPVEGKNQDALLDAWVKEMQAKDWSQEQTVETNETPVNNYEQYGEGVKEGSLILDSKGNVCIARYGQAVPLDTNDKKVKGQTKQQCLKDYTAIKTALNDVLDYQTNNEGDKGLQPLLDKLNKAFDQFVNKYGHFHSNTAIAFLRNDVDYASVGALETYREKQNADGSKTPIYGKADVFSKRVVEKEKEPQPTTIKDGVIASIYKFGGIDIPYIAQQLGLSEEEAKKQILDNELGYENPDTMQVDVSYVYLSGNVREKQQKARENNVNGKYAKNISALEKKIPADIPAHLIEFNLGSTWIENKLYTDFFKEMTGKNVSCRNLNGGWVIDIPDGWTRQEAEGAVISDLCDKTIYTSQLIAAAMQGKTIKVQKVETHTDVWGNKTSETITDKEATQACAARIEELKAEFKDWARAKMQADPELSERTEKTYNERFNNYSPLVIPNEYSPSHYGGQVTTMGGKPFRLNPHQSKAVIKGITQPVLLAHEVGSGKTFTLISTAMEMRRIGTAKKPMIVVQNATVGQFAESAKQLYPGAKVLMMDEDHSEAARKAFYAKIKYNDWDLIIISQSVLDKIPDNPDRQIAFIRQKIDEKEMVLEQLRANKESGLILKQMENEINEMEDEISGLVEQSRERQEKKRKRDEKKRAVAKQNAAVRAKEQLDRSVDEVEDFDDMDIDAILVDEAHGYKKLGFESVMQRVKGVDTGSSKKCASLFLKTRSVLEKSNGKNVVFATGTPVSNTAAEVWTFMRYLMPADVMKEYGIYYFDDFARNFGNVQQMLEFSTSGKFKENNRFAGYVNMPELARIWNSVADTVLNSDIEKMRKDRGEESKIPELEGGKATDIYLPQTKALRSIMKKVRYILEQYENMSGKEKKRNSHIPLVAYGIAKAAAVDARLVDGNAEDDPNSKTNEAVRQTLKSLKETEPYHGTVAIFADNYQNKHSGFNLYQDIKKKLVEQGVPEDQIAIISGSPKLSDKKKLEIFDKVNKGEIRVVLGSTFTLGTGVNIQERLHTLIHIDAPNRPMDYTQRNGRILRQGNLHKEWGIPVRVLRFGVEDSLDVTAYQRLKTKGAIADSVMHGNDLMKNAMDSRVLEEEEDTFGDTVAQLSGSEFAMKKNQAEREVRKLEAKKKQYEADQIFIHSQLPRLKGQNKDAQERIESYKETLAKVEEASKNGTVIEIGEGKYDNVDAMSEFFTNYNSKIREIENNMRKEGKIATQRRELTVKINGFDIKFTTVIDAGSKLEKGRMVPFTTRNVSYSCEELWGNNSWPCKGGYIKNGVEEILNDTMTGNDYRESIETAQNTIDRNNQQINALEERQGRDFAEEEALQQAKDRLEDFTQKMKEEMEAKEAKYKEMDAEVEEASDLDWDNDEDEEETTNQSISFDNPLEAIEQIGDNWKQEQTEKAKDDIAKFVYELPGKYGFKGTAITQVVNSREELEALRKVIGDKAYKAILETYNNPINEAAYVPRLKMVVIFNERMRDKAHAERTWWHEQTHHFWHTLSDEDQREYGLAVWNFLDKYYPETLEFIQKKYNPGGWYNEGCSFFIGELIKQYGTDNFLINSFEDVPEISNFVAELKEFIQNGRKENEEGPSDSSEQLASVPRSAGVSERGDLRGRNNEQSRHQRGVGEEEIDRSIGNPLDAISRGADEFKDGQVNNPAVHSAKAMYDQQLNQVATVFSEAYRDNMIALKKAIDAIVNGKEILDSQNPYMQYNLMHGKNKVEMDAFNRNFRDPMLATIHKIMNETGMNWGDIDRMLFTKSGLERNRQLYVRDWLEKKRREEDADMDELARIEDEWNQLKQELYDQLKRGDIAYADYLEEMRKFIRANMNRQYDPSKHDYSGFRDMYGDEDGKYDEADIIAELADTEDNVGSDLINELWAEINATNEYSLERYREAGMRSDEQIDKIKGMFNFYVPMRGFKEESAEDVYQYMTNADENGVRHLGGLLKKAKGRGSEADFPVSTMLSMGYKAIADCNKNMVNQKLYRLVQANPNDLIVLSDSWARLNESTGEWEEDVPNIPEDATEDEVRRITLDWQDEMRQLAKEDKAKKIRGKANFDYKPLNKENRKEHIVEVRINGDKKLMTIAGNPRAAQALNGQLGFERNQGVINRRIANNKYTKFITNFGAKLLSFRQAVSTNYSLNFVWRNAKRDWSHFSMLCVAKEGGGYAKAAEKYYFESLAGKGRMRTLFKKYREGTLDESKEIERDFKDFMDNGGVTGFVQMQKVDEVQNDLEKLMKAQKKGKPFKVDNSFWDKMLTAIEAYNEAIENRARFATYRASRHYAGRTKARSAYDAKEITANFNKRGAGRKTATFKSKNESVEAWAQIFGMNSQVLNENKMFFNASVQAIATLGSGLENADNKTKALWFTKALGKRLFKYGVTPFALASFGVPMLNRILIEAFGGGDDDDPYANLPEWVRRNNICIYVGNGNFFTFAIGQELAAFYSLGDMTAGLTFYPELRPVDKDVMDEIIGFLSVFSPVDVQTKVTQDDKGMVESALSNYVARIYSNAAPLVNISENLSWSGRPIYKEDDFGQHKYDPEYMQVFDGTGTVYKAVSKALNRLGGGNEVSRGAEWSQINPATMEYLTEQYFGGVGRTFVNTGDVVGDVINFVTGKETDFNIRKVEGARALFQQSDDRTQYYRTQAKFRKYRDEAEKLENDIKGWAERAAFDPYALMEIEKLSKGDAAARLSIYRGYKPYIQQVNSARNKAEGSEKKELSKMYNTLVKDAVEKMDKVNDIPKE